jgi:hypothetical protein
VAPSAPVIEASGVSITKAKFETVLAHELLIDLSDNSGTAAAGGDMGYVSKGATVAAF